MAHIRSLDPQTAGVERLCVIASALLHKQRSSLTKLSGNPRVAVMLCLPERMDPETGSPSGRRQRAQLVAHVEHRLADIGIHCPVVSLCDGHAAFASALIQSTDALRSRSADAVILGGLDTGYDPDFIQEMLTDGRLFDNENLDCFCPGEGGAFFVATTQSLARQLGLHARVRIDGVATAKEPGHLYNDIPCKGDGLTAAAAALTKPMRAAQAQLDWWFHDLTNEFYRVHEFRCAWPRTAYHLMPETSQQEGLHGLLGDLGAAFAPTALAIAGETFERGGPGIKNCMVSASSLYGLRGAIIAADPDGPSSYAPSSRSGGAR